MDRHIALSVREEPQHFLYLNNGLTAYCQRLEVNNLDRANAEEKRIRAFGFFDCQWCANARVHLQRHTKSAGAVT